MKGSLSCTCGHTKSNHNKRECTFSQCSCKKFKVEKETPIGDPALVKAITDAIDIKIDGEKIIKKLSELAGESNKNQPKKSDVEDKVERDFSNINELAWDYEQKIAELDEILKKDVPERHHIKAWIEKGINLRLLGEAKQSLQCFVNVLLKDKKNIQALTEMARSHVALEEYLEAISCCQDVLDIDEKNIDILNYIAYCYLCLPDYDIAISYYEKVLKIDERNVTALDNLGYCHKRKKQYSIALDYFRKSNLIETKEKDDTFASNEMLHIYWLTDEDDAALKLAKQLIKDGYGNHLAYYIAGYSLSDEEKYDEAIPLLRKSVILSATSKAFNELGFCFQRKKRFDLAILYYEKALDKEQMDLFWETTGAACDLGKCYYHLKEYQTALNNFDRALKIDPEYTIVFYWKLRTYIDLEKFDEVVKNCPNHHEFPDNTDINLIDDILAKKRMALRQMEQYDDALNCSDEMIAINPSSENYVWEGWILQLSDRLQDAKMSYDNAIKIDPENDQAYSYMAMTLMDEENFEDAIDYYKKAWDISKDDEMILQQGKAIKKIGNREESDEKFKEAEEIFDSILESKVCSGRAWLEKGNCNWNLKKYNVAEDCWLTASEIIPEDAFVWLCLGDVRYDNNSYNEALLFYEKSLLCDNSYTDALQGKGNTYRMMKEWSKAIDCYNEVLRLDNNFSRALYLKAFTYKILEKYTDASNHFAEFIKKFPKDEMIVNAWAFKAYSENYLKKYDNALESCKNALDLAKGNTNKMTDKDTTWSIGLIFQEKGLALEGLEQYADAINCYKKFQPTDDNYSWVLKRIIKCLGKLGKISEQKVYRNKLKDFDSKKAN